MGKLKRVSLLLTCIVLSAAFVMTGCKRDKTVVDEKVVNVRVYKGGYGADYIYELKKYFEAAYADEGYKVNILTPSFDMSLNVALTEMAQGNAETGVDLYFTGGVFVNQVSEDGEYGLLVEDLTEEVWNKPAIKFDGTEEDVNIIDKIPEGVEPYLTDSKGRKLGFNYMQSVGGMVVNTRKLAKYGLELPKTTNELFECFDAIYLGANGIPNSEESTTFPITYVSGTNGYTTCFLEAMMAQYEGLKNYNKFYSMLNDDGSEMIDDGYEVFKMDGLKEMLKVAYRTFDNRIAAYGSTTQSVDQAQAKMMKDGNDAVFMCNGDWMLNEVKMNYKNALNDISFINFPVISALGIKLFGSGTDYNMSDEQCDELLSYIVGLVDENKSIDEIIAAVKSEKNVTITEYEAGAIAEARGIYYSRGVDLMAYVTKDAVGKEPAMALLRMYASDDFSKVVTKTTNGLSAFARADDYETEYSFVDDVVNIVTNRYTSIIRTQSSGLRRKLGLNGLTPTTYHIPVAIVGENVSMFDGKGHIADGKTEDVYWEAAQARFDNEYDNAVTKWPTWLSNAGIEA